MLFPQRIRELRRQHKLLQRDLARAIGVDVPMYSRFEHGERHPKREQVVRLARLFKTDPDELVALWLADTAFDHIAHDKMSARASQLLVEQLSPSASTNPQQSQPQASPTGIDIIVTDASPVKQDLVARVGDTRVPHFEQGPAHEVMRRIADESIDCIVTAPPYWSLRNQASEGVTAKTLDEHLSQVLTVMAQAYSILQSKGSLWVCMGDAWENGTLMGVPGRFAQAMIDRLHWQLHNDIVLNQPPHCIEKAEGHYKCAHEHLFHFVKSPDHYCDDESLRFWFQKLVDRNIKANEQPNDVWTITPDRGFKPHYNVMSEDLCRLIITSTCRPHGLVLDPYCGTGTTNFVASKHGFRSIGIDSSAEMLKRARRRCKPDQMSLF